jgi:hypothetical protein
MKGDRYYRKHGVNGTRKSATTSELSSQRGNIAVLFTTDDVKSVAL